jgi:hypothetical protein
MPDRMNGAWSTALLAFVLAMKSSTQADVCVFERPKPIRHVCGLIVDSQTEPIGGAKVTLFKRGKELLTARSSEDGKFDLQKVPNGHYELLVEHQFFKWFRFAFIVTRTSDICTSQLRVEMATGIPHDCENLRVVEKPKK